MDTSAAAAAESTSASIHIKQEPGGGAGDRNEAGGESEATEGGARIVRKMTVLDPLRLKLLGRQDHNRLLSGLLTEKAKAKPPAPTPAPAPSSSTETPTKPEPSTTAAEPEAPESLTPIEKGDEPVEKTPDSKSAPIAKPVGTLFRRKKVVPVAIAKKIAQKEKSRSAAAAMATTVKPVDSEEAPTDKPIEVIEDGEEEKSAIVTTEQGAGAQRPTAFRRIKPKVSININQSRPKKSILKKSIDPKSLRDLIPEATIVLDDDDEEEDEQARSIEEDTRQSEEEERRRIVEEEKVLAERRRIEEEEKALTERRKKQEEEEKALAERRKIEEEKRRAIEEEMRKIQEREERQLRERVLLEEKQRTAAAEQQRIAEEKRKAEEEEQRALEKKRIADEEEEVKRIEEIHRSQTEEDRNKAEELQRIAESVEAVKSRKSVKIPAEVWKLQMQKMRNNPSVMHSAVIVSENVAGLEPAEERSKESVIVKNSETTEVQSSSTLPLDPIVSQEIVNVVIPETTGEREKPAEQVTPNPTKTIRKISRLPPSVALKLINSFTAIPAKQSYPDGNKEPVMAVAAPITDIEVPPQPVIGTSTQTKSIRRISRLPPSLAMKLMNSVAASAKKSDSPPEEKQEEKKMPTQTPTVAVPTNQVEHISKEMSPTKPAATKEIRRIARLPASLAMKLLSSVGSMKTISSVPTPVSNTSQDLETAVEAAPVVNAKEAEEIKTTVNQQPVVDVPAPAKPTKEIRRISQLPPNIALKLMNALKNKNLVAPKPEIKEEEPGPSSNKISGDEPAEIKVEPRETLSKSKRKVHILSQVILPSASYNLEELLAGKSTEGFNTIPSGKMPIPLPMRRIRRISTVPAPKVATEVEEGSKQTVNIENEESEGQLDTTEEYVVIDNIPGQEPRIQQNDAEEYETEDECQTPDEPRVQQNVSEEYVVVDNVPGQEPRIQSVAQQTVRSPQSVSECHVMPHVPISQSYQPPLNVSPSVTEEAEQCVTDVHQIPHVPVSQSYQPSTILNPPQMVRPLQSGPDLRHMPNVAVSQSYQPTIHVPPPQTVRSSSNAPVIHQMVNVTVSQSYQTSSNVNPSQAERPLQSAPDHRYMPNVPVSQSYQPALNVNPPQSVRHPQSAPAIRQMPNVPVSQSYQQQQMQTPLVTQQSVSTSGHQSGVRYFNIPSTHPAYQQLTASGSGIYPNRNVTLISRGQMNPQQRMASQQMVLNPVNMHPHQHHQQAAGQPQRPFAPTQIVLVRHAHPNRNKVIPAQPPPQLQSQQHLLVPRATFYHRHPSSQDHNQIIVPTPRFMLAPNAGHRLSQHHSNPTQQPQMQRSSLRYTISSLSPQKRAFRPVEPVLSPPRSTNVPASSVQQHARIIPKIVIDSSYVENDRPQPTLSNSSGEQSQELSNDLKHFSPCSQAIKNKLRDKLRAKMLKTAECSESSDGPASPPVSHPSSTYVSASTRTSVQQNFVPLPNPPLDQRLRPQVPYPAVPHPAMVYHPQDFQLQQQQHPHRIQEIRILPQSNPQGPRPIKQYIYGQGRKIFLTKISVTKPVQKPTTTVHHAPMPIIHKSPMASSQSNIAVALRSPQRVTAPPVPPPPPQQLCESAFHGFPQSAIKNEKREFQRFRDAMKQLERKDQSLVTAVTTPGPEGEMFIITELDDVPLVTAAEAPAPEAKQESVIKQETGALPKISIRRHTFVVDDSDCEISYEQLPRVSESPEDGSTTEKDEHEVKFKVEDARDAREESYFSRHVKQEDSSVEDSNSDQADEDLAREILAIVQKERKSLRVDSPGAGRVRKVKKRRKRRKRPKKEDGNEQLVDLLMKHVNQESLIADMVATQRKQLHIIELSDTEDDGPREIVREVKTEALPEKTDVTDAISESVESDQSQDGSEIDIFAEILKPFEVKNPVEATIQEDVSETILEKQTGEAPKCPEEKHVVPFVETREEPSVATEPEASMAEEVIVESQTVAVPVPSPVIIPEETSEQICDTSALQVGEELPKTAPVALRAPKRKLKPTLVSRFSKIRKIVPAVPPSVRPASLFDTLKATEARKEESTPVPLDLADIEDSSDAFSDRDESGPATEPETVESNAEKVEPTIRTVREILNEWNEADSVEDKDRSEADILEKQEIVDSAEQKRRIESPVVVDILKEWNEADSLEDKGRSETDILEEQEIVDSAEQKRRIESPVVVDILKEWNEADSLEDKGRIETDILEEQEIVDSAEQKRRIESPVVVDILKEWNEADSVEDKECSDPLSTTVLEVLEKPKIVNSVQEAEHNESLNPVLEIVEERKIADLLQETEHSDTPKPAILDILEERKAPADTIQEKEQQNEPPKPIIRDIVDEWDSEGVVDDSPPQTEEPKKHISFGTVGNTPFRVAKKNVLQTASVQESSRAKSPVQQISEENSSTANPEMAPTSCPPVEVPVEIVPPKCLPISVRRVSVRKADLLELTKPLTLPASDLHARIEKTPERIIPVIPPKIIPEPVSLLSQLEKTPPRKAPLPENTGESVKKLLKDWEDSPIKKPPQLVARVLLDRIDTEKYMYVKRGEPKPVPKKQVSLCPEKVVVLSESVEATKPKQAPCTEKATILIEPVEAQASQVLERRTSKSLRSSSSRLSISRESIPQAVDVQDHPACRTRNRRSGRTENLVVESVQRVSNSTKVCTQTTIKNWLKSTTDDPPNPASAEMQEPVAVCSRRNLRSRTSSVFYDHSKQVEVTPEPHKPSKSKKPSGESQKPTEPKKLTEVIPELQIPSKQPKVSSEPQKHSKQSKESAEPQKPIEISTEPQMQMEVTPEPQVPLKQSELFSEPQKPSKQTKESAEPQKPMEVSTEPRKLMEVTPEPQVPLKQPELFSEPQKPSKQTKESAEPQKPMEISTEPQKMMNVTPEPLIPSEKPEVFSESQKPSIQMKVLAEPDKSMTIPLVPNKLMEVPTEHENPSQHTVSRKLANSKEVSPESQKPSELLITEPQKSLKQKELTIKHQKSSKQAELITEIQRPSKPTEGPLEPQKPAGRTLRSRTKSMFVEQNSEVAEPQEIRKPEELPDLVPKQIEQAENQQKEMQKTTEEPGSSATPAVVEVAGGKAGANEEPNKSIKPTPFISNRIPIPISSEDEDDAPLAKRRKVLRKKRSTLRSSTRDLNANRHFFRSSHKITSSTGNDSTFLGQTDFIKTEPPEIQDMPEQYDSFTASSVVSDGSSGRLLSVVTVQNNQVVHAENYDEGTVAHKQYVCKSLIQTPAPTTPRALKPEPVDYPAATSTPKPVEPTEHVFATPEPIRLEKRKRRTKLEMEADKQAKLLSDPKQRLKRDCKVTIPPTPETVDPSVTDFLCGNCSQQILRADWDTHYASHSGLAYRVGIDPVVELLDETTAVAIVTRFMKSHRQITVQCDKCGVAKKSALGLVSHRMICGMTAEQIEQSKLACQHCNRKLLAVSMATHLLGHCPVLKRLKKEKQVEDLAKLRAEEEGKEDKRILNQRGGIKRKATSRAEKRIQNISCSELILPITKADVTEGCLAIWKTQFRKAKTAKCIFQTCEFVGNSEAEMRLHHEFCPSSCEQFECKNCRYQATKVEMVVKHIKIKHTDALATAYESSGSEAKISDGESSEDDGTSGVDENEAPGGSSATTEDEGGAEKPKKARKRNSKSALLKACNKMVTSGREMFNEESDVYREMILDEVIEVRSAKGDFHRTAHKWTMAFRQINYSIKLLFSQLRPDADAQHLALDTIYSYMPARAKSMRFTIRYTNLYNAPVQVNDYREKWQQLDAFSGQTRGTDSLFYCGGPVVALDWLPMGEGQARQEHQILAVACKSDFDEFHLADRIYPSKCLIQIWDIGFLFNDTIGKKADNSVPKLLYSIACDFGPIWALRFCPSGCYNTTDAGDDFDRLGLLAATGSDGDVYIFSLSKKYTNQASNSHRIIHLKPVLRLTLTLHSEGVSGSRYEGHSAVKLSWSKAKNHAIIAAGYSNGAVAVWNLNSKSPLLTGVKEDSPALLPVHRIFIPDSCVTALDLHWTEDSRYLLVCNADRKVLVYDLHTGYLPVEVCSVNARSKVTGACWNTHFPVIVLVFDDVYAIDRCALTLHQSREIGLRLTPLYSFTAEATDMSGNDWLSNHVVGTDGGDVMCHQPMPFVHHMTQKNTHQHKYILTSTMSVKITDDTTDTSYNMFDNNFGLLFSDNDKSPHKMDLKSLQVKSYRRALLHEYPGIRVNQVRWNPNDKCHQYYAVGYQAGFVRVRGFRLK